MPPGEKYTALALLLVCLAASLSLSQTVAILLLCQFCGDPSHHRLCQSVLLATGCVAAGTAIAVGLLCDRRRRVRPRPQQQQQRPRQQLLVHIATAIGCAALLACAAAGPAWLLTVRHAYPQERLLLLLQQRGTGAAKKLDNATTVAPAAAGAAAAAPVTRLALIAGDWVDVLPDTVCHKQQQRRPSTDWFSALQPDFADIGGGGGGIAAACQSEAAVFLGVQLHLCAFNATLVAALLVLCVRMVGASVIGSAAEQRQRQEQQLELQQQQVDSIALQPMPAGIAESA